MKRSTTEPNFELEAKIEIALKAAYDAWASQEYADYVATLPAEAMGRRSPTLTLLEILLVASIDGPNPDGLWILIDSIDLKLAREKYASKRSKFTVVDGAEKTA